MTESANDRERGEGEREEIERGREGERQGGERDFERERE